MRRRPSSVPKNMAKRVEVIDLTGEAGDIAPPAAAARDLERELAAERAFVRTQERQLERLRRELELARARHRAELMEARERVLEEVLHAAQQAPPPAQPPPPAQQPPAEQQQPEQQQPELRTCAVCMEREPDRLLPCKHLVLCGTCVPLLRSKHCPVCRKAFKKVTRVFL